MADNQPRGRNSEGVVAVRHPRASDLVHGWMGRATGDVVEYTATSGFGWYTATQSLRMAGVRRLVRDTNPSTAWVFQNVPGIVNPALFNWTINSLRNVRDRSLYQDGEKRPSHGQGGGSDSVAAFDPAVSEWTIDSQRMATKPYWTSRGPNIDWLTPDITAPFNPSTQPWSSDSQRPSISTNNRLMSWTRSGYFISLLDDFEAGKFPWKVDNARYPGKPYWTNLWLGIDWILPENRQVFDPAVQCTWSIPSARVPAHPYWRSEWIGNDWINPTLLAEIAFNPAIHDWTTPTTIYQSRDWWSDSPEPIGWLVPAARFDGQLFPATVVSSHRHWQKSVGRWQPDLDNAWLTKNPVVPNTFSPSFVTESNVLLDAGGSPFEAH